MKYDVIQCSTFVDMIEIVNIRIKNGWKCQGGLTIDNYKGYCQAMILAPKKKVKK